MIGWSGTHGPVEQGDPDLQDAVGTLYAEGATDSKLMCCQANPSSR